MAAPAPNSKAMSWDGGLLRLAPTPTTTRPRGHRACCTAPAPVRREPALALPGLGLCQAGPALPARDAPRAGLGGRLICLSWGSDRRAKCRDSWG